MGKTLMIGIGGAGCELATHLQKEFTVRTIAIDTNKKGLARCGIQEQLLLDADLSHRSLAVDANLGRRAAEASSETLAELLVGVKRLILVVGLGGSTGTGAASVIARLAKEKGIEILAAVTLPFSFETSRRPAALLGLVELMDTGVEVLGYDQNEAICEGGVHAPLIATLTRAYGESRARLISFLYQALN